MSRTTTFASIAEIGQDIYGIAAGHIDRAFRHILRGPLVTAERSFVRLITGEPHPFGNLAIFSNPADDATTREAIEPLCGCGAPAAVLIVGTASTSVRELLRNAGFEPHGVMPAMAVEIDSMPETSLPAGYSLARVGSGDEGDEWADVFSDGYELPRGIGRSFSPNVIQATTAADAPIQYFAIRKGGRMVGTSLAYLADGVAGIYCVATLAEDRGQGLGAHLTAEPLRMVRELGYRVGVLQSSPAGHSVYRKLGFADVGDVLLYMRVPAQA